MGDLMPDYHVEQQKMIVQVASLKANKERAKLELMEVESRKKQIHINLKAADVGIKEAEEKLFSLEKEHGQPVEIETEVKSEGE